MIKNSIPQKLNSQTFHKKSSFLKTQKTAPYFEYHITYTYFKHNTKIPKSIP